MKTFLGIAMLLLGASLSYAQDGPESGLECTSILVGRLASTDGSVITSHTCDGWSHTWVNIVPAKDHKKGEKTAIRKNWRKTSFIADTAGIQTVCEIPQVRHTFSYVNTGYPSLNEKQVGIGETTFTGPDTLINPDSPLVIEELCRLGLERGATARETVRIMGELAEKYGYGDGGECLTVADPKEAWQFEIVGVGKHKTGAAWVAQRIPDGEVGVSANIPRIGRIDRNDKENFMVSDGLEQAFIDNGLWDGQGDFVFYKALNCSYGSGKNFKEREFYILSHLAPSLGLTYDMEEMPFSVKPDSLVSVRKVMEFFRNTYEGCDFDMCRNVTVDVAEKDGVPAHKEVSPVANPWLSTNMRNTLNSIAPGTVEFTRTLAVAWCAYSTVIQLRSWLPDEVGGVCWFAVDNPGQSPRIPIFCGGKALPTAFERCGHKAYDPESVLWKFRKANKLATVEWQTTKKDFLKNVMEMEDKAFEGLPLLEDNVKKASPAARAALLDAYTADIYNACAERWAEMEASYWLKFGRGF